MKLDQLEKLRCPFCGGELRIDHGVAHDLEDRELITGILLCDCCAFPVVAGIPYLRSNRNAELAMEFIGKEVHTAAATALIQNEVANPEAVRSFVANAPRLTFRQALAALDHAGESSYLLYRFSDPTFLAAQAVLRALAPIARRSGRAILDVGGGTGQLTRVLRQSLPDREVWLADLSFWKLWLARQIVAPSCVAVCCDANQPLPFADDTFGLLVCADAFHYIWSKRLLAGELGRLAGAAGVIVLPHLHNACSWNPSQGMPLSPSGYARLFREHRPRLFGEGALFEKFLATGTVDLSGEFPAAALEAAAALLLVAGAAEDGFRRHALPEMSWDRLAVNPLYHLQPSDFPQVWKRVFPTNDYEEEYADCKRYLPEHVTLSVTEAALESGPWDDQVRQLARQHVLLDLPPRYV